ncbi:MAG: phage tail protein [Myxococcales bacterium]|nr:phage tail protein [Myxococcales bacterium]
MALASFGLSMATGAANSQIALDPFAGFNFFVSIEGLIVGGFKSVSGLSANVAYEEYREGGHNHAGHHFVGGTTWSPLVLSHGMTELDGMWSWFEATARGVIRKRNLSLMVLDEDVMPRTTWNIFSALPVRWNGPELDATNGGLIAVESIEMVHGGMKKPMLGQLFSAGLGIAEGAGARGG